MLGSLIVQDPRLDVAKSAEVHATVVQGAERITHVTHQALSYSSQQANWNIQPPSGIILDRDILVKQYFEAKWTGLTLEFINTLFDQVGGTSVWAFAPDTVSFRQAPLGSITESTSVIINGENINDNVSQKIHAFLCYGNTMRDEQKDWSRTQMAPDLLQQYDIENSKVDVFSNAGGGVRGVTHRNVIFDKFEKVVTGQDGDGTDLFTVTAGWSFVEPLWISPFGLDYGSTEAGLCNVDSLQIIQRFRPLNYILCGPAKPGDTPAAYLSNFTISMDKAPEILCNYLTPNPSFQFPFSQTLNYHKSLEYQKEFTLPPEGPVTTCVLDTIRLSQIPESVYFFAAPRVADTQDLPHSINNPTSYVVPNTFLRIGGININFENQSGILSTYNEEQIYEACVRNGLNCTYDQFRFTKGSVVKLNFSKDIGLTPGVVVGQNGSFTFQATLSVQNAISNDNGNNRAVLNTNSMTNFTIWQVFIQPGGFTIVPNSAKGNLGLYPVAAAARGTHNILAATGSKFYGGGLGKGSRWNHTKRHVSAVYGGGDPFGKRMREY